MCRREGHPSAALDIGSQCRRVDLSPIVTHHYALDDIEQAYDLFSHQADGVLKVALYPNRADVPTSARSTHEVVQAR